MPDGRTPRVSRLFESHASGRHPIGRILLGTWLTGNAGVYFFGNLPSLTFAGSEWATWMGWVGAVSTVVFVIGEGIWEGRPIGWYGGICLGLVFTGLGAFQANPVGVLAGVTLLPYLVTRRDVFFADESPTD